MSGLMREVGAFEAKNKLGQGQLLNLVEQGEEVIITRHSKEVGPPHSANGNDDDLAYRAGDLVAAP